MVAEVGRVVRRGLRYRRTQTVVSVLVIAVLSAVAAAAPWYARMVSDEQTAAVLAVGSPDGAWRIDAGVGTVPWEYRDGHPLFVHPITSRTADLEWSGGDTDKVGEGALLTREAICDHLTMVEGRCPTEPDEVAVSAADLENWAFRPGERIGVKPPDELEPVRRLRVTGVYEVTDPSADYWYGRLPTGRSGWRDLEIPVADAFVTVPGKAAAFAELQSQHHLDQRIDGDRATAADLPAIRGAYLDLADRVERTPELGVVGAVPETLDTLEQTFATADRTIALTTAQLAALALVALLLTAGLTVSSRRRDIGLRRLRGQSRRSIVRASVVEWLVVAVPGAVLGGLLATVTMAVVAARWLPGADVFPVPWSSMVAVAAVLLVSVVLVAGAARRTAAQPIPMLLRATDPRAGTARTALLVLDLVVLTVAGCALLVALTSPDDSPLVLLTPVLLAVAAGVLACRVLALAATRRSRRTLERHPGSALAGFEIARGGGLRSLVVLPAVVAALLVLATQAALVGDANRDHRAEVETGAALVYSATSGPLATQRALDTVDPERRTATVVAHTGRAADAARMMYVEPEAFSRIAYGIDEATRPDDWSRIAMTDGGDVPLEGDRFRVRMTGEVTAEQPVVLRLTYLGTDGAARTERVGALPSGRLDDWRRTLRLPCAEGCRLLAWSFVPNGDASLRGSLSLSQGDDPIPLEDAEWDAVIPDSAGYELDARPADGGGLDLRLISGGWSVDLQSAYVPTTLPVLAPDIGSGAVGDGTQVRTPGHELLPIDVQGRLTDATPQQLQDVLVADLAAANRYGERTTNPDTAVEIWFADGVDPEPVVDGLAAEGVRLDPVADADAARAGYAASAEARASRVNPAAAGIALVLAAGCVLLTVAGSWRRRRSDLGALDLVGVPRRLWRRATYVSLLLPVATGVVVGALAGLAGTAIALRRMPIFAQPEPAIGLRQDLLPLPLVAAVLVTAAVVLAAAAVAGRVLVTRAVASEEA